MKVGISIIVPCYRQAEYLDECLSSVLSQTYGDWECLIVNDGSPDNTKDTAEKWCARDKRFLYFEKENGGPSSARNYGIEHARGKYILPLDADDRIGGQYMELALQEFNRDAGIKLVYCNAEFFGVEIGAWSLPVYSFDRLLCGNIIFCSGVYLKEDWNRIGGYDETMHRGFEDWEFWIRLLKGGGEALQIKSVQFFYRRKIISRDTTISKNAEIEIQDYIIAKHMDVYNRVLGNAIQLHKELRAVRNSLDYKLGHLLLFIPKQIIKKLLFSRKP